MLRASFKKGYLVAALYDFESTFPVEDLAGSVCAFGVFDGVHAGHQFLLDCARRQAQERGAAFAILTFDTDPDERFHPARLKKLMSNEARLQKLAALSDAVVVLPFTREFSSLSPIEFLDETLGGNVPLALHVGCDIRFGAKAQGTVDDLSLWGSAHGMEVRAHKLFETEGAAVTATRIRLLLEKGEIEEANKLLGYPYSLVGRVLAGRGEGANMGFRTANLIVEDQLRVLGDGVYAAYATVGEVRYKAAVNVGVAATFAATATATCEAHLLDFEGNLYGETLTLEFVHWLRPMKKFDSLDELIATVNDNISWVRANL